MKSAIVYKIIVLKNGNNRKQLWTVRYLLYIMILCFLQNDFFGELKLNNDKVAK